MKHNMKQRIITTILLVGLLTSCNNTLDIEYDLPELNTELTLGEKLQTALNNQIISNGKGISVAIIFPDGKTWKGVSGVSKNNIPITQNMLFSAGSITKTFTAATIMQMVEEGKIELNDQIIDYFPSYPFIDGSITIRQLLNHTSGIFNITDHPMIWQEVFRDTNKFWDREDAIMTFTLEPYFIQGTDWHYSNTGYILLSMIIEQLGGSGIVEAYHDRLFLPNNLNSSFLSGYEAIALDYATGWYDLNGDGLYDELPPLNSFHSMAGGVVFCTAHDLAKWTNSLFHDKTVVNHQTFEKMIEFESPCPGEEMIDGYGLGIVQFNSSMFNNLEVWGHGGNDLGYAAGSFYLPNSGISIAIMDNTEEGDAMWVISEILTLLESEF